MTMRYGISTLVVAAATIFVSCSDDQSKNLTPTSPETAASHPVGTSAPLEATFDWELVQPETLTSGSNSDTFRFTAKVKGGVAPYTFEWDFGDGNVAANNPAFHSFYRPGKFHVKLTVSDSSGKCTGAESPEVEIEIEASAFTVECDASPTKGSSPLTVRFRGWPDGNIGPVSWEWDFGDGGTSNNRIADHTYRKGASLLPENAPKCSPTPEPEKPNGPINFLAVLTATDNVGRSVSCTQKITVE